MAWSLLGLSAYSEINVIWSCWLLNFITLNCLFLALVTLSWLCYWMYRVAQKSKPLPNFQKIMFNRIKVCQWDYISSSN